MILEVNSGQLIPNDLWMMWVLGVNSDSPFFEGGDALDLQPLPREMEKNGKGHGWRKGE